MRVRQKVIFEARKFTPAETALDLVEWSGGELIGGRLDSARFIRRRRANPNDWIVKLNDDHFVVLTPTEFAAEFEPV